MRNTRRSLVALSLLLGLTAPASPPAAAAPAFLFCCNDALPVPYDLADRARGSYYGKITADARGRARPQVRVTVTKAGPDKITVVSDYPRIPVFTVALRESNNIVRSEGSARFLLDLGKRPAALSIVVDGASWSGTKR